MVRLGKNGTDVTSAAIRLSRFITKKNKMIDINKRFTDVKPAKKSKS